MRIRATLPVRFCLLASLALSGLFAGTAGAATHHVNNRVGNDQLDGRLAEPRDGFGGPFRSIRLALQRAQPGDTIIIAATDQPYYESLELVGRRFSGGYGREFTIIGNGAVISGAQAVPAGSWVSVQDNLWKFLPERKGFYQLIRDDLAVPEAQFPHDGPQPDTLPEGHWCHWRGEIYFQAARFQDPNDEPFEFAAGGTGMTLHQLRDLRIRDLTFRHFRIDGVALPGSCQNVLLKNVHAEQNGRAGFSAWGFNRVTLEDCTATGNRVEDLRVLKPAHITSTTSEPAPPASAQ